MNNPNLPVPASLLENVVYFLIVACLLLAFVVAIATEPASSLSHLELTPHYVSYPLDAHPLNHISHLSHR